MTVQRLEHIGIVVDEVAAATAFFVALGPEVEGEASVEGELVDRINGPEGGRADITILRNPMATPRSSWPSTARPHTRATAARRRPTRRASATSSFSSTTSRHPSPACKRRGGELVGELVNYENSYWLCYVRGPAGIIVELAEKIT